MYTVRSLVVSRMYAVGVHILYTSQKLTFTHNVQRVYRRCTENVHCRKPVVVVGMIVVIVVPYGWVEYLAIESECGE